MLCGLAAIAFAADAEGHVPDNCGDDDCKVEQLEEGDCSEGVCEKGKQCAFAYTGWANSTEGQKLDEKTAAEPMVTSVGVGNLLPGMDNGYVGMCVGEKRRVTMPPKFHWKGHPNLKMPPMLGENDPVVYEAELVAVHENNVGLASLGPVQYLPPLTLVIIVYFIYNFITDQVAKEAGAKPEKRKSAKRERAAKRNKAA